MKCEYCNMTVEGTGACPYCGAPIPEISNTSSIKNSQNVDFNGMFDNDFFNNFNMEPGKNVSVKNETHTYVNGKEVENSNFDMDKFKNKMKRAFQPGNSNIKVTSNNPNVDSDEVLERVTDMLDDFF